MGFVISFEVSPVVSSDALNELFASAWEEHSTTDFDVLLERSQFYICAFDKDVLVGFVKFIGDGGMHGFLLDTTVHAEYQKQGIGQELVRRCLKVAKEQNISWVHVDYEAHLENFYTKCGFRPTKAGLVNLERYKG